MKFDKIKFSKDKLYICQVSLKGNIPIIIKNYQKLKLFYEDFNIFVICPKKDFKYFKKKLRYNEFTIINENQIISFHKFEKIFYRLSKGYRFKSLFKKRLSWYYQQILKLAFVFYFLKKFHKKIILWDADTIIAKKIEFFSGDFSRKFGTFTEFHKSYFETNKVLLGKLPKYFISSVVQFGSITKNSSELGHFMKITGCCSVCGWDHTPKYCQSNSPMNFDNRELVSWRTDNGLYTMAMHPQSEDLIYFIAYPEHEMGFQGYGVASCFSGKYGITKIIENNNNLEKITHPPGCGENNDDWVHP